MAKKKWYDTWWGLLWTLAVVDAIPGRGLQAFMELDAEMKELPEFQEETASESQAPGNARKGAISCPADASADC